MQSNAKLRNATQAGYLSKTYSDVKNMPFCASQISIFNSSDHTDTALTVKVVTVA
jgi:hypothetical protein